ncbi:hypothetical protein O9992_13240 [Vibrio lentus]|nr:hypothetical protein [Vibrio lentus]
MRDVPALELDLVELQRFLAFASAVLFNRRLKVFEPSWMEDDEPFVLNGLESLT